MIPQKIIMQRVLQLEELNEGDIFKAREELVGVYCFSCHPNDNFNIIKNSIYTINPRKICVYIGEYWEGSWDWAITNKKKMLFIRIIYEGNLLWTNIDWLKKIS